MASANFVTVDCRTAQGQSRNFSGKQDPPLAIPVIIVVKVSRSYSTLDYLIIAKFGLVCTAKEKNC